jgi:hypothetical protein
MQPKTGMIEGVFSADFSETFLNAGLHQYYGTLRVDHVEIDELAGLVVPDFTGSAHGSADVNLAFRGSGFSWPEAKSGLEARARVRLNHVVIEGEDEPEGDSGEGRAGWLERCLDAMDAEETVPGEHDLIGAEAQRLLTGNRAAGWFTMHEGTIHTNNLVAIHEGSLIEIQGSIDTAGHLQVQRGRLFTAGRRVPFRIDCMVAQEGCRPTSAAVQPETTAADELSAAHALLSEASKGVYNDLRF